MDPNDISLRSYAAGVVETATSQDRTLTSALHRLREIAGSVETSNERSGRFLDALVGASREGEACGTGTPLGRESFVSELHSIIDRLDRAANEAARRSSALLAAGGEFADPTQGSLRAQALQQGYADQAARTSRRPGGFISG